MSTHLPIAPDTPWLAPLAGYSDLPFRLLCREYGCSVAVTEMVSAKGLIYNSPGTEELLQTCPQDTPLVVQFFGAEEHFLLRSMERLQERGFVYFDLNCGCSVRKVVKTGSGAALLKDPVALTRLAQALATQAGPGHMGFKIRLGWDQQHSVYHSLAQDLEQAGAAWITLHPRWATQGFTGTADWTHLEHMKQTVQIPVIASGDLFTADDALRCIEATGVDSIMFARGALADPGIFARYLALYRGQEPAPPSFAAVCALVDRLEYLYTTYAMPRAGLLKMRTLVPRLLKGWPGAKTIRRESVRCTSWAELQALLQRYPDTSHREEV
ncbi:tRNA-dihydrouridine synthase family protein [Desulfovibrionales bacterium]